MILKNSPFENFVQKRENAGNQHFCPFSTMFSTLLGLKSQQRPTRKVFVYKIQVNPIHTILKYGNYYDFMDR